MPPLVRVSVFGAVGVGKTRLIDSYVNRSQILLDEEEEHWGIPPTTNTEVYYKLTDLDPAEETDTLVLEIEDCPGTTILAWKQGQDSQCNWTYSLTHSPAARLLQIEKPNQVADGGEAAGSRNVAEQIITPLSHQRSGIILVFSLVDMESFREVAELHSLLTMLLQVSSVAAPVLIAVGTKDDLVGGSISDEAAILEAAESFTQSNSIPLFKVSAVTGKGVQNAFSVLISEIGRTRGFQHHIIATHPNEEEEEEEGESEDQQDSEQEE